jgi:hypothetical protein
MNVKLSAVSLPQRKTAWLSQYFLAMSLLALAFNVSGAQELAPVIDAAGNAWVDSLSGGGSATGKCGEGGIMQSSPLGCSGNAMGAGVAAMGIGSGTNCNYGVPLWAGACEECGCAGCAGGCSGGGCGGRGCGSGGGCGLLGGATSYAPLDCDSGCSGIACGGGGDCGMGATGRGRRGRVMGGMMGLGCGGSCGKTRRMRLDVWGEYLYLRPRNAEVAYAVPIDGPIAPTNGNGIQIGPTGIVDMDYQGGFRLGFNVMGPNCTGIMTQWTRFESHDNDAVNIAAPNVIRSLVTHPLGIDAASDGLQSTAELDIDFDLVDLSFRLPWKKSQRWCAEVLWGLRYGGLNQQFTSSIDFNGTTTVDTDIDFQGVGPRIGLLAQRRIGCHGIYAYSQGDASFLVGTFDAEYTQRDTFAGLVVDNSWEAGRIVPQLDYELGIGVMSPGGRCRIRAGYIVSAWFNTVRTNEFINSVQTNNQDNLGDGISFDGLTVRAEMRF